MPERPEGPEVSQRGLPEELQRILDSIPNRKFRTKNLFEGLFNIEGQESDIQPFLDAMLGRDYRIKEIFDELFNQLSISKGGGEADFTKIFEMIDRLPGKEYKEKEWLLTLFNNSVIGGRNPGSEGGSQYRL